MYGAGPARTRMFSQYAARMDVELRQLRCLNRPTDARRPAGDVAGLLDGGWVRAEPIVYEDFLPRSAAGIFQSNLTGKGTRDDTRTAARYDREWLAGVLARDVHDPFELYGGQQDDSIAQVARSLQLVTTPDGCPAHRRSTGPRS